MNMGRKDVFCADLRGTFWDQVTLEKYAAFQHNCIETVNRLFSSSHKNLETRS